MVNDGRRDVLIALEFGQIVKQIAHVRRTNILPTVMVLLDSLLNGRATHAISDAFVSGR